MKFDPPDSAPIEVLNLNSFELSDTDARLSFLQGMTQDMTCPETPAGQWYQLDRKTSDIANLPIFNKTDLIQLKCIG